MKKEKKICFLTSVHSPFDIRIYHKEIRSLVNTGYEVSLIAPAEKGIKNGVFEIIPYQKPASTLKRILFSNFKIIPLALKSRANIFHFHDPELILTGLTLKALQRKVIYDVHEDTSLDILSKPYLMPIFRLPLAILFNIIEKNASRFFDAVITPTKDLKMKFSLYQKRTTLVRNFPWKKDFQKTKKPRNKNQNEIKLIYIGSLSEIRGVKEIFDALEYLPKNVKLIIAGAFYSEKLMKKVLLTKRSKKVMYLGKVHPEKIPKLLQSADIGLTLHYPKPGYLKALPTKLFEYMAAGIPVIISHIPYWKKIVEKEGCGLAVDPKNPEEIAEAVKMLKENPELRKQMGERGRKAFLEKFNFENEEKNLLKIYEELTS